MLEKKLQKILKKVVNDYGHPKTTGIGRVYRIITPRIA